MMKKMIFSVCTALIMGITGFYPVHSLEPWTNGQNAVFVLGQPDFTTKGTGVSSTAMQIPKDVAIDYLNGKLYVLDSANHRVLRFTYPPTQNQPAAELVFGQADFNSSTPGTNQNTFYQPRGLAVDSEGRLWVSEYVNNRIVWFNQAYALTTNQPNADGVLGQPDFTSQGCGNDINRICHPYGLTVSSDGTLYVADGNINSGEGNNRVLRFDNAATKANGADADGVLGQPDFTSTASALSQNGMDSPRGVALYGSTLYVSERNNRRVLRFDNAATKANGAYADSVLGQPNFTTNTASVSQTGMDGPGRITLDSTGRLYVSDGINADRVIIFNNASSKPNGGPADYVLGQPDFTSQGAATAQNRLDLDSSGGGLAIDWAGNYLFVADDNNNRVMVFRAAPPFIILNPDTLAFTTSVGTHPGNKTVDVSNGSAGDLVWTATVESGNPPWLSISPSGGNGDGTITVSVDSAGLAQGNYARAITISADGAANTPQVVNVTLEVTPQYLYLPLIQK